MSSKLAEDLQICPKMLQTAKDAVLKYGKVSSAYLVRKLSCTHTMAWLIIMALDKEA
jgi:hypothetical protein